MESWNLKGRLRFGGALPPPNALSPNGVPDLHLVDDDMHALDIRNQRLGNLLEIVRGECVSQTKDTGLEVAADIPHDCVAAVLETTLSRPPDVHPVRGRAVAIP